MTDRILTTGEVLDLLPYSKVHLWRMVRAGTFPAPLQLSERRVGWREADIKAWIDNRQPVAWAPVSVEE